jgi:hypothetical protein
MPVQKFKTFEDAEKALLNAHPDDAYFARVAELWNFADQLNRISYPRGIFKFKTIEEANKHREQLELAHIRKKQEEIRTKKASADFTNSLHVKS